MQFARARACGTDLSNRQSKSTFQVAALDAQDLASLQQQIVSVQAVEPRPVAGQRTAGIMHSDTARWSNATRASVGTRLRTQGKRGIADRAARKAGSHTTQARASTACARTCEVRYTSRLPLLSPGKPVTVAVFRPASTSELEPLAVSGSARLALRSASTRQASSARAGAAIAATTTA